MTIYFDPYKEKYKYCKCSDCKKSDKLEYENTRKLYLKSLGRERKERIKGDIRSAKKLALKLALNG